VNFLIPFDGTPLAGEWTLTPQRCLRILAMVRFVCPSAEVRLAGGREIHLRTLQPLALHVVNSIFLGDYLTSEGQPGAADLAMIADAGFTVEGADTDALLAAAGIAPGAADGDAAADGAADGAAAGGVGADGAAGDAAAGPGSGGRPDLVHVRRRGAGTAIPANT
jgi:biotin synthase